MPFEKHGNTIVYPHLPYAEPKEVKENIVVFVDISVTENVDTVDAC